MNEILVNEVLTKLNDLLDPQGLLVSGNGIIIKELNKINETLQKVDKKLFFMEQRQQRVSEIEHPELKKSY